MTTLAPKLPWKHPYAPGYPGRGSQALPADPDAVDYLNRVAAADGASVEVGIAQAIDGFVKGCKADGTWDAIQASCIMCGARTLAGALVPLKGTAPTPYNFVAGDYSRSGATPGLKGDGTTKYIDTNRANNADGQNDKHLAVYATSIASNGKGGYIGGYTTSPLVVSQIIRSGVALEATSSLNDATGSTVALTSPGLIGASRLSTAFSLRADGVTTGSTSATTGNHSLNSHVFARNANGVAASHTDARLAFYSIGSALDLAALDTRVTNMVTAIRFHTLTGLLPNDYDPATVAYITAAYAAGGTL